MTKAIKHQQDVRQNIIIENEKMRLKNEKINNYKAMRKKERQDEIKAYENSIKFLPSTQIYVVPAKLTPKRS